MTVVTSRDGEQPIGLTASAVASLSLEPTMLLVCLSSDLHTGQVIERSGEFAVSVLGEEHESLAMRFASPIRDKFSGVRLRPGPRLPVLDDAIAYFVCKVADRFPGGDHTIFTGQVEDCGYSEGRQPLLYYSSDFQRIDDPELRLLTAWYATDA